MIMMSLVGQILKPHRSINDTTYSRLDYLMPSVDLEGFIGREVLWVFFHFFFQLVIKFPEGKDHDFLELLPPLQHTAVSPILLTTL